MKKRKIIFFCSPSLALLDSWLPVLRALKEKNPALEMTCVFPINDMAKKIDLTSTLICLSEGVFDEFIFKSFYNEWYRTTNYQSILDVDNFSFFSNKANEFINKTKSIKSLHLIRRFLKFALRKKYQFTRKKYLVDLRTEVRSADAIFFDVYEQKKSYLKRYKKDLLGKPKFSISHGLNLVTYSSEKNYPRDDSIQKNTYSFIFSSQESSSIHKRFGVPPENQVLTGIQRHDPKWIHQIIQFEKNRIKELFDDFIFVISRPPSEDFLPQSRMRKSIEIIKKIAWDYLDTNIVIKLHPKEGKLGMYEEIFGVNKYNKRWMYSNLHPFTIGSKCAFAVCYLSGVPLDLLMLNSSIPTIEILDLRGIKIFESDRAMRDTNGEPVRIYRYHNLVLGASDYETTQKQVDRILNQKKETVNALKKSYYMIYEDPENSIQKTANKILEYI